MEGDAPQMPVCVVMNHAGGRWAGVSRSVCRAVKIHEVRQLEH